MKSEQDAQIDGTIHYLEEIKETEEYKNAVINGIIKDGMIIAISTEK